MEAKELFEKLGYEQKIHTDKAETNSNGIQYIKRDKDSEMNRVGRIWTSYIEFYYYHREIVIYRTVERRDGTKGSGDMGTLSLEEFTAVQKQVEELGWQNK